MPVPPEEEMRRPLLEAVKGEAVHNFSVNGFLKIITEHFGQELGEMSSIDKQIFKARITDAKNYLMMHELIANPSKQTYVITKKGTKILEMTEGIVNEESLEILSSSEAINEHMPEDLEQENIDVTPQEMQEENEDISVQEEEYEVLDDMDMKNSEQEILDDLDLSSDEQELQPSMQEDTQELHDDLDLSSDEQELLDDLDLSSEEQELQPSLQEDTQEILDDTDIVNNEQNIDIQDNQQLLQLSQGGDIMPEIISDDNLNNSEINTEINELDNNNQDRAVIQSQSIDDVLAKHNSDLADKVLMRVASLSSDTFNALVIDLLSKMGYRAFQNARYTNDDADNGMIQGVILDTNGTVPIYIHAKKLSMGRTVGRADVQDFVEALADKGSKGIFATSANFSENAALYAQDERIMLIDGPKLASLMISHNFCVNVEKVFEVKEIDEDGFSVYEN